jgi:23S rRNA (guanosine2251-2'-O)-methyltransferase
MRKPFRPRPPRPPGGSSGRSFNGAAAGSSSGAHAGPRGQQPPRTPPNKAVSAKPIGRDGRPNPRRAGEVPHQSPDRRFDRPAEHGREHPGGNQDLVFGVEPIRELIAAAPATVRVLHLRAGLEGRFAAEAAAIRQHGGRVSIVSDDELERLAGAAARHQGLVASIREYQYAAIEDVISQGVDPIIIVDGVTDPRNLGAILRSAECAGVRAVVIAKNRTAGITPAAIKASSGAWIHLTIAQCGNVVQALEALKAAGYWIAALAPGGDTSIYTLDTGRKLAIVLGSEDRGVRELVRKHADFAVNIPMRGQVASLNVSVAAAVALFEIVRRRADQN